MSGGRRRGKVAGGRSALVQLRFTEGELAELKAAAARDGFALTAWLAMVGSRAARGLDVERLRELDELGGHVAGLRYDLAKIGNNLNQIAHRLNAGHDVRSVSIDEAVSEVRGQLVRLEAVESALAAERGRRSR